tara:strand:+ start:191 stop:505 length:315 start_codon:yes stop_codon:yes gene_type:complete
MILALALLAAPAAAFAQAETNVLDLVGNEDVPKARVEIGSDNGVPGSQLVIITKASAVENDVGVTSLTGPATTIDSQTLADGTRVIRVQPDGGGEPLTIRITKE